MQIEKQQLASALAEAFFRVFMPFRLGNEVIEVRIPWR